jgi:hypothetical protein
VSNQQLLGAKLTVSFDDKIDLFLHNQLHK